jgi:sugar phosphate isomerase/epimerase
MTLCGISTSTLGDKSELQQLTALEPDLIEFYNYPERSFDDIVEACAPRGIRVALHVPTPYAGDRPMERFAPTGFGARARREALDAVARTLEWAERLDAVHVVVHFPSPYPPYDEAGLPADSRLFLDALCGLAVDSARSVLIENLSAHPHLRTALDYHRVLGDYPELGLCLDLGHAYLVGAHEIDDFVSLHRHSIRSAHVYSTHRSGPERGRRTPAPLRPTPEHLEAGAAVRLLADRAEPAALVLEHGADHGELATNPIDWLRAQVAQGRDQHHE